MPARSRPWPALARLLPPLLLHVGPALAELHRTVNSRPFPRAEPPEPPPPLTAGQQAVMEQLSALVGQHEPRLLSVAAAALVGFCGVLPLLVIPLETGARLKQRDGEKRLRLLLSFAVGGLVGDVFLHLLPEAMRHSRSPADQTRVGLWVIAGIFLFALLEMVFSHTSAAAKPPSEPEPEPEPEPVSSVRRRVAPVTGAGGGLTSRHLTSNGRVTSNGHGPTTNGAAGARPSHETPPPKQIAGYLNLLANSVDNFTHGLAIGGSFLASTRIGLLTTFAILIHEIPHEVGDFAILLKSGFSRWEAAKAQMATATLGMTGAISALLADDPGALGDRTAWILPFTAGGFIHIALVGVLPEVCQEREPLQCVKQGGCMLLGVLIMLGVTLMCEH